MPSLLAGVTAAIVVVALSWDAGGYFAPSFLGQGVVAFAGLAAALVALALVPPRYRLSTEGLLALAALAGLAVWSGLSTRWSTSPDGALLAMERALLYVGVFGLGLVAVGSGRYSRHVVWGVLAIAFAVVGSGLLSRLVPSIGGQQLDPIITQYRLSFPLGYWNALGALAAMTFVLAVGLAAAPRSALALRGLAAGAAVVCALVVYLALSRGAVLAVAVGLVVLVVIGAHRASLLLTLAVVGLACFVAIVRLRSYPALVDDPHAGLGQAAEGRSLLPQVVGVVILTAVAQALLAAAQVRYPPSDALRQAGRRGLLAVVVAFAVVATGAYLTHAAAFDSHAQRRLDSAGGWISRQWHDFLKPTSFTESGTARLATTRGTRSDLYRVAIDGFEAHPLRGDGAGSFEYRWMRTRRVGEKVRNAHSLELETLGELGAVGALLLLAFIVTVIVSAVRARLRPGGLGRAQGAAVSAAVSVWIVHSAVDWDWQVPGLTVVALLLAATLFPYGRVRVRRPGRGGARSAASS